LHGAINVRFGSLRYAADHLTGSGVLYLAGGAINGTCGLFADDVR
jgi:hypothetical protein